MENKANLLPSSLSSLFVGSLTRDYPGAKFSFRVFFFGPLLIHSFHFVSIHSGYFLSISSYFFSPIFLMLIIWAGWLLIHKMFCHIVHYLKMFSYFVFCYGKMPIRIHHLVNPSIQSSIQPSIYSSDQFIHPVIPLCTQYRIERIGNRIYFFQNINWIHNDEHVNSHLDHITSTSLWVFFLFLLFH